MELTKITSDALNKYFNALTTLGYIKDEDSFKLIIISFLETLLSSEMKYLITEEYLRDINKAISCLLGTSCLLPMNYTPSQDSLIHSSSLRFIPRITEDKQLRITQLEEFRIEV